MQRHANASAGAQRDADAVAGPHAGAAQARGDAPRAASELGVGQRSSIAGCVGRGRRPRAASQASTSIRERSSARAWQSTGAPPASSRTSATSSRRRHREDHDRPPRGAQRVPAADDHRALRRVRARPRGHRRSASSSSPARARWPSARAATSASAATRGYETEPGSGASGASTSPTCTSRSAGCPSRSSRWSPGYAIGGGHVLHVCLRPDDRRRQRALRPDRPAGRLVRRRLRRRRCSRAQIGPEAREGDLVPLPPVRRAAGARHGASSTRSCRSTTSRRRRCGGAARCSRSRRSRCGCSRRRFNADEDGLAGIQQLAHDTNLLFYASEEAREGREAYKAKRTPDFAQFPQDGP